MTKRQVNNALRQVGFGSSHDLEQELAAIVARQVRRTDTSLEDKKTRRLELRAQMGAV